VTPPKYISKTLKKKGKIVPMLNKVPRHEAVPLLNEVPRHEDVLWGEVVALYAFLTLARCVITSYYLQC
jgi:hypothetical protein